MGGTSLIRNFGFMEVLYRAGGRLGLQEGRLEETRHIQGWSGRALVGREEECPQGCFLLGKMYDIPKVILSHLKSY